MFSFTTQTIYNAITPATDAQVKSGEVKNANLITSTGGRIPSVRIGNTRFDLPYVTDIQIKAPSKESLASVTFNMADACVEGKVYSSGSFAVLSEISA